MDGDRRSDQAGLLPAGAGLAYGLGVLVAGVLSANIVGAGLRWAAKSGAPVEFGYNKLGDSGYPRDDTILAVAFALMGVALLGATVAAFRGHKRAAWFLAALLVTAAVGAVVFNLGPVADRARCVEDSYSARQICADFSLAPAKYLATTTLPLLLGAAGLVWGRDRDA